MVSTFLLLARLRVCRQILPRKISAPLPAPLLRDNHVVHAATPAVFVVACGPLHVRPFASLFSYRADVCQLNHTCLQASKAKGVAEIAHGPDQVWCSFHGNWHVHPPFQWRSAWRNIWLNARGRRLYHDAPFQLLRVCRIATVLTPADSDPIRALKASLAPNWRVCGFSLHAFTSRTSPICSWGRGWPLNKNLLTAVSHQKVPPFLAKL